MFLAITCMYEYNKQYVKVLLILNVLEAKISDSLMIGWY